MATVLIIEDEKPIAELIKDRLEQEGYNTAMAYTVSEGLEKLKESKPDAITLDIYLPDNSGLNLLKMIKNDPKTFTIPVIIVSSSDEAQSARELGADDFVSKPVNFKRLLDIVNACSHKKEASPQGGK